MAARQRLRRLSAVIALTTLGMLLATGSPARSLPRSLTVKKYKVGLNFPVSMAWHEGKMTRVFYTEKATGKIRIIEDRKLLARELVSISTWMRMESVARWGLSCIQNSPAIATCTFTTR